MSTAFRRITIFLILGVVAALSGMLAIGMDDFVGRLSPAIMAVAALGAVVGGGLMFRAPLIMWIVTFLTLVIVGSAKFFIPGSGMLSWISYGVAALLFLPAFAALAGGATPLKSGNGVTLLFVMLILFFASGIVSWSLTPPKTNVVIAVTKTWIMFGGVWAFLAFYPLVDTWVKRWLAALLAIGILQWFPILYQSFFLRAVRESQDRIYSADVVVGTFGGTPEGGGLTGVLAFYLVCGILILLGMYRGGALSRSRLYLLIGLIGLPLLLVEVKAVFFYLPIGLAVLYGDYIRLRPRAFIGGALLTAVILYAGIWIYGALHWGGGVNSASHLFGYSFQIDTPEQKEETGLLTRAGAPLYWWNQSKDAGLDSLLFGYGLGASRTGGQATGWIALKEAPMFIDRTAFAAFLWDVGLFGVTVWYTFLFSAFLMAGSLRRNLALTDWHHGLAASLQSIVPLFALSTLYRNDIPYAGPMMFLFMSTLGLLFWLHAQSINTVRSIGG